MGISANSSTDRFPAGILTEPRKRWHLAFICISVCNSLPKSVAQLGNRSTSTESHTVIDIEQASSSSEINPEGLCLIVKQANDHQRHESDGITRQEFGFNTYNQLHAKIFSYFVVRACQNLTAALLLACAVVSLGLGIKMHGLKEGWYDGCNFFISTFIVIAVSSVTNYMQHKQLHKLSKFSNNIQLEVIRSGQPQQQRVAMVELAVSDVICLGDYVPADTLSLFSHGHGHSLWRNRLASTTGKFCMVAAFFVLIILLVRYFTGNTRDEDGNRDFSRSNMKASEILYHVFEIIATAVTIVVVAIPEGLPLAVTLAQAYSMNRMMADQVMGSVITLYTDKTGSLTSNLMKVAEVWLGETEQTSSSSSSISSHVLDLVGQGLALDTACSAYEADLDSDSKFFLSSEKTLLLWVINVFQENIEELENSCNVLHAQVLKSEKERSGVVIKKKLDDTLHVHRKGAPEKILAMCSSYYDASSGLMKDLNGHQRTIFGEIIQGMAAKGLRCIALAHKQISKQEYEQVIQEKKLPENSFSLLGIVGTTDPCGPEVRNADIVIPTEIQSTEIAKGSSDIVFLDDDYATIFRILMWRRHVYNNMQKIIQLQLTITIAALLTNSVAAVSAGEIPLHAAQLLWVNLIMDTLAVLALASENPTEELMAKPSIPRTEPLITNRMLMNIFPQVLYQIAVALTLQFKETFILGEKEKASNTFIFNTCLLCQVFNIINARKLEERNVVKGIHKNKLFWGVLSLIIIIQVIIVELMKKFAGTKRLNWVEWGVSFALAGFTLPMGFLAKCIPVSEKPIFSHFPLRD